MSYSSQKNRVQLSLRWLIFAVALFALLLRAGQEALRYTPRARFCRGQAVNNANMAIVSRTTARLLLENRRKHEGEPETIAYLERESEKSLKEAEDFEHRSTRYQYVADHPWFARPADPSWP